MLNLRKNCLHQACRQRGVVLILLLLLVSVGALTVFVSGLNRATQQLERDRTTDEALAQAKTALIGWVTGNPYWPGMAPFPDRNGDGNYDGDSDCYAVNTPFNPIFLLGRLPGRAQTAPCVYPTYGLSTDLRDGTGEMLWYAVSRNLVYDYYNESHPAADTSTYPIINAGSLVVAPYPWLTVRDGNGNVLSSRVALVIISPGLPQAVQNRIGVAPSPIHYLDNVTIGSVVYSNADSDGCLDGTACTSGEDFIMGGKSDNFNDRLIYITIDELMPLIEKRVAQEARRALLTYYVSSDADPAKRYFPYAAPLGNASAGCQDGLRNGHLPGGSGGNSCICSGITCSCAGAGPFDVFRFTTASGAIFSSQNGGCTLTAANRKCNCSDAGVCASASPIISDSGTLAIDPAPNTGTRRLTFNAGMGGAASFALQGSETFSVTGGDCTGSGTGACSCSGSGYCETISTGNWSGSYNSSGGGLTYTYSRCSTATLTMPAWFAANKWENYIYYALADACSYSNQGCDTGGFLTVGAVANANALLISVGRRLVGTKCAATPGVPYTQATLSTTNICDYLDSSINTDIDDIYDAARTPRTSLYNDQMFIVSP